MPIPAYIGHVLSRPGGDTVGTCFHVAENLLATAAHVLADLGATTEHATVSWRLLTPGASESIATVARVDFVNDLAVLRTDGGPSVTAAVLRPSHEVDPGTPVRISGSGRVPDVARPSLVIEGSGTWQGQAMWEGGTRCGRLTCQDVLLGMSGAPVRRVEDDTVVGVVSGRYNSATGWLRDTVWVSRTEDLQPLLDGLTDQPVRWSTAEPARPQPGSGPGVRSDYLSQVRRIAPQQLIGRERELELLSEFCLAPDSRRYLWLRAEAWAGKSALLSSFVLDPPAGVRVVSFFVTARLAGQSDRVAFAEVVLEQLLELVGEQMPTLLTDATRDAHLLGVLFRAAEHCRARGEWLILVVDGLDEDQGVTTGADAHSIAALLPADPPPGLRVVVAGRPNPPVPADVPDDHPLRDPENVHALSASTHAEVVRQDAERELIRLLHGPETEQNLLGLLTAAGGGLSGSDLAELTESSDWEIARCLRAVSGRTFTPRAASWAPGNVVYILGHEELQQEAVKVLGPKRLAAYRQRLHDWAESYRDQSWPARTPEYLLRGYFSLLHATNDVERMLRCAMDALRHNRMLDIIGGDTSALTEVLITQQVLTRAAAPDLVALSRLSVHRTMLAERNTTIPSSLPGVWVRLGRPARAEALARSITDPFRRVQALAVVLRELAAGGDGRRAEALGREATRAVDEIGDPYRQAHACASVARGLAEAGDARGAKDLVDRAETMIRSLTDQPRRAHVLVSITRAVAAASDHRRAERIALSITTWSERAQALGAVAIELAGAGRLEWAHNLARSIGVRAERAQALAGVVRTASANADRRELSNIARRAHQDALRIRNPARKAWTLAIVAEAVLSLGQRDKASAILAEADQSAKKMTRTSDRDDTRGTIARQMVQAGDEERAEAIVRAIEHAPRRVKALAAFASGLAASGHQQLAEEVAQEAEALARSIVSPELQDKALATLSREVVATGDLARAEALVRSISDPSRRDGALTAVAEAIAASGDLDQAERVASSIADSEQQATALTRVVRAAAALGYVERARKVAQSIGDTARRQQALAFLSDSENHQRNKPARPKRRPSSPEDAEAVARSISDPYQQFKAVLEIAQEAAAADDRESVRKTIGCIAHRGLRARATVAISRKATQRGNPEWARDLLDEAHSIVDAITSQPNREQESINLAQGYLEWGDQARAEEIVRSITNPSQRAKALVTVGTAAARSGELREARRIVFAIPDTSPRTKALAEIIQVGVDETNADEALEIAQLIEDPVVQSRALGAIVQRLGRSGQLERAEAVAESITQPATQAQVLASLTAHAAAEQARHLLGRALIVGHWTACLEALIRAEPGVVSAIAEEYLHVDDLVRL